jgi:hypothetical protein
MEAKLYHFFFAAVIWKRLLIIIEIIQAKLYLLFFAALIWQPTSNYNLNNGRKTLSFALASSMLGGFRKFHL